jgi:hypothetical protein
MNERSVSHFLRWSARTRRFGWLHPTILPETLCTMGCTFPRTQRLFSIATIFITTKRSIQTRMYLSDWVTPELTSCPQFFVQPRSLHGRYADVCRIEQAPQRNGSGSLGVWRGVGILRLIWSNTTEVNFFLLPILLRSRRICPGIHVAERELWLAISRLLWAFDIQSLPDEPISLEEYEGESGRTPLPYRVKLIPRHDRMQALLEAEKEVTLMKL